MIEAPRITHLEARHAAIIHLTVTREEMPKAFGSAIEELMRVTSEQGVEIVGPVFAHHLKIDPKIFEFEVGVPVAAPVGQAGRVAPSEIPAAKVAQTVYQGPYEGLPQAWGEFHEWLEDSGHAWAPDVWESYVVHGDVEPDPSNWRTVLSRPLVD